MLSVEYVRAEGCVEEAVSEESLAVQRIDLMQQMMWFSHRHTEGGDTETALSTDHKSSW